MTFTVRSALAVVALAVAGAAPASASVAVVGDSLGVGTEPHLRAALPEADIAADAVKGRTSAEGLAALPAVLGRADSVVFDLGTNDDAGNPVALTANLDAARSLAAGRCLVLATLNAPPLPGVSARPKNRAIAEFAAATPTAVVVDWHAETRARPGLLAADGVHATPAGYAYRGRLFAAALRSCRAGGAPGRAGPPPAAPPSVPGPKPAPPTPTPVSPGSAWKALTFTLTKLVLDAIGIPVFAGVALGVAVVGSPTEPVLVPE